MSGNVIVVAFGVRRTPQEQQEQFKLLMNRVLEQHYDNRYAEMLTDFHYDQVRGFKGNIKQWLQGKLGAVEVSRPCC